MSQPLLTTMPTRSVPSRSVKPATSNTPNAETVQAINHGRAQLGIVACADSQTLFKALNI